MDEFELIQRYFVRQGEARGVITGIGDDGAVLRPDSGRELIAVIDTLVAGVHFPDTIDAADLGYRAVAVNLSDIAAMGGRPRWMMLALTMPSSSERWIASFADGLHQAADEHSVALVGGDTTSGANVVVSVQITGDIAESSAILRSGAKIGDTIFVTGSVGDAAAGFELMSIGQPDDYLSSRYLRPEVRVDYGQSLVGVASAAIDLSDGLLGDLKKLLNSSGVGAEIDIERVPISDTLCASFDHESQRRFALLGGDDYELCFTAKADALPDAHKLRVTAIGTVTAGNQLICRDQSGIVEYDDSGYRHFK